MEQSPNLKSNLNSEMSDLVHQAEEWARIPAVATKQKPHLEEIFNQILYRASIIILENTGVKTKDEFEHFFGSFIPEQGKSEKDTDLLEVQRKGAISSNSLEELQNYLKKGWTELLEEPLPSKSPFDGRRRTSLFSDMNLLSPIISEASKSPEKIMKSHFINSQAARKPLFNSMSTPKTPWRRGNSMYIEEDANMTLEITSQRSLSTSRLSRNLTAPMNGETPLENRASRLRRMKMEEKLRESNFSFE